MDKGRTGPQGPLEEPDENQGRSRPPLRRSSDGTPIDRRREQRPTGPAGSTGRIGPNSAGPTSRRLNPQRPPEEMPGTKPPMRRASRTSQPQQEPPEDTLPRSRPLNNPGRGSASPQQPLNEPDADAYERRARRPRPEPEDFEEEEDYYERRPRSRRLPEDGEDDEVYYERRPLPRRQRPESEDFEEEEDYYEPRPRSQRLSNVQDRQRSRYRYDDDYDYGEPRRKRRRVLPIILTGCGLTIFTLVLAAGVAVFLVLRSSLPQGGNGGSSGGGGQVALPVSTMTVNLTSVTRIQVCNKIGNVTLTTDPNASTITVATKKSVPQGNRAEADQILTHILTSGTMPNDQICQVAQTSTDTTDSPLIIKTDMPKDASADITVTLPTQVFSTITTLPLKIEAPTGNIDVSNLTMMPVVMDLNERYEGNITVKNVILGNNSKLRTNNGNVIFSGFLALPTDINAQASYRLQSEKGNINVTLPSTNVLLDACTNSGKISSDFNKNISAGGQTNACGGLQGTQGTGYNGSFDPNTHPDPPSNMFLVLHVSIGDIVIKKSQI